jgi:hypothetical protein
LFAVDALWFACVENLPVCSKAGLKNIEMSTVLKNRKKFPLIPVLVFLALFTALIWYGYSHFIAVKTEPVTKSNGINTSLPQAAGPKSLNKLEIYLQAEKDSASKKEQQALDPYSKPVSTLVSERVEIKKKTAAVKHQGFSFRVNNNKDDPVTEIDQKLDQIQKVLKAGSKNNLSKEVGTVDANSLVVDSPLVNQFVERVVEPGKGKLDPELQQLEGMLDKLMEIQHPELVKQKLLHTDTTLLRRKPLVSVKGSVEAVVHNTQMVTSGSILKLRLLQDWLVDGTRIPKGNFVYGVCVVNNERLTVQVSGISLQNAYLPLSLSIYDRDGMEGIYIPGAISRDVSKEGVDKAIQSLDLDSYQPSFVGRITNAGLQATKALFSKKVRVVRVTVKAGHQVILRDTRID